MLNPATHNDRYKPNVFTATIIANQQSNVRTLVRLRNGTMIFPQFKTAEDDTCSDCFATEDWTYCWHVDGTSFTRPDYDMMEIITQ